MVLPQESSSSSADAGSADAARTGDAPRRFERAITWTRVAGAVAALLITPLFANLGLGYVFALAGFLVLSQDLGPRELVAIGLVVTASAGATRFAPPPPEPV